ncbi:M3 family oligoendopeptidase [Algisphaera agarilytica]|uniref:Oligoendopeptidase F n=1 Tax=Algisphaera agarilytica TaxID=1385975 RepID=A0A7X0H6E3_9BACT|nr:M3 family oligoendopeptidase [Algisphaera agarilytica]MBB6430084.1 oligoendopeptidase F [Algisphaera agarilytica]
MTTTSTPPARHFVAADFDPADWAQVEPYFKTLIERELESAEAVEQWLTDYSELSAVMSEYGSRRNIDHACHTDDEAIEKAYMHWVENIAPKLAPLGNELKKKYLDAPGLAGLNPERYDILTREWKASFELFREANVPLSTEVTKLNSEYDKTIGAMLVDYDGKTQTLQQLARYQEETDRAVRQETWELSANRRLEDREKIDQIFQDMFELREQMAKNADCENYLEYSWKSWQRFDYTPKDCEDFADAIESVIMPRIAELDEQRKAALGVDTLRPWDGSVDVKGRSPLRPFPEDDAGAMVSGAKDIFSKIEPSLAKDFATLKFGRNLDLDSRKGKRAGGFQASLAESKEPFIFMNAAGTQRDVDTMLHEAGHAFHYMWASQAEPLTFMQHAPIEFCEVASMSMELMGCDHYGVFYDHEEEAARAKRKQLEGIIRFFPWMATIDMYQHWLYSNPGHDIAARTVAWKQIAGRFTSPVLDYTGYDDVVAHRWHAQLHLFHIPFYYVEYGIAQLGALQLWLKYKNDPASALQGYRDGLTLGGTKPLPQLFEGAGIKFDFTKDTLAPLIDAVADELEKLPE